MVSLLLCNAGSSFGLVPRCIFKQRARYYVQDGPSNFTGSCFYKEIPENIN